MEYFQADFATLTINEAADALTGTPMKVLFNGQESLVITSPYSTAITQKFLERKGLRRVRIWK